MFQLLLLFQLSWGLSSSTTVVEEPSAIPSAFTLLPSPYTYHVFLSFRGDIRYETADWFYTELVRAGFNTFRDVDEIETGKDIEDEIEKAIRESKVAVVLLSNNFASSTYCLDELARFMERRSRNESEVVVVFYKVDPDKMLEEGGSYGAAFKEREEKLGLLQGDELQREERRLLMHREALRQVALVKGRVYDGSEPMSDFVKVVVADVNRFVNCTPVYVPPYLVGIDSLVKNISRWMQDELNVTGIGLIYGPRGIGKKTIAKVVYNENYEYFDSHSFLEKVGETIKQVNGIVYLQKQLLSNIKRGKTTGDQLFSEHQGIMEIQKAISNKRVLIVLTDVDQLDQLYAIVKEINWLKKGSKIIITSNGDLRERRIRLKIGVRPLDYVESGKLLCWHAFGISNLVEEYRDHIVTALQYCCGFPSVIEALGKVLNESSPGHEWVDLLLEIARQEIEVTGSHHGSWCRKDDAYDVLRESRGRRGIWRFILEAFELLTNIKFPQLHSVNSPEFGMETGHEFSVRKNLNFRNC